MNWAEEDSNLRSDTQQIYSLSPLATRESALTLITSLNINESNELVLLNTVVFNLDYIIEYLRIQ